MKKRSVVVLVSLVFAISLIMIAAADCGENGAPHRPILRDGTGIKCAYLCGSPQIAYSNLIRKGGCSTDVNTRVVPGDGDDAYCICKPGYAIFNFSITEGNGHCGSVRPGVRVCEPIKEDKDNDTYFVPHAGWVQPKNGTGPAINSRHPYDITVLYGIANTTFDCNDSDPTVNVDCNPCGNGICEANRNETCSTCSKDCGICNVAHNCSSPSQTIMRLSTNINALGALWNQTSYIHEICYDEFFSNYTKANPHACTEQNKVLSLKNATGSKASISHTTEYNIDVCYGDLKCEIRNNQSDCLNFGGLIIASLNNTTDSLISYGDNANYSKKLCCKPFGKIDNATWQNMMEQNIGNADLKDMVKLRVFGQGFEDKEINYTIYKDNIFWFDRKVGDLTSSDIFTTWKAGQSTNNSFSDGTYYFIAKIEELDEKRSNNLVVSSTENNSMPRVRVVKPALDSKIKVNTMIDFVAEFIDEDDDLSALWKFGDNTQESFTGCLTTKQCYTNHSYLTSGTKIITIIANESTRDAGQSRSVANYSRVFIFNAGLNTFAVIDNPMFGMIMGEGEQNVDFDASGSFVANCTIGACSTCTYNVSDLNCSDIHAPHRARGALTGYELQFNWTFSEPPSIDGTWTNDYDLVVEFSKYFSVPTSQWANLRVSYVA